MQKQINTGQYHFGLWALHVSLLETVGVEAIAEMRRTIHAAVTLGAKLIYSNVDLTDFYSGPIRGNYRMARLNLDASFRHKFIFNNC